MNLSPLQGTVTDSVHSKRALCAFSFNHCQQLGHGAVVNVRDWHHKTPLHLTSLKGSLDMSQLLIEHGADVDAQDDKGQTPFSNPTREEGRLSEKDCRPSSEKLGSNAMSH